MSGQFDFDDSMNQMGEGLDFLTGLTVSPPVIGRIAIGGVDADFRPYMDDGIHITSLCQNADNSWDSHHVDDGVRKAAQLSANEKLRSIPVRLVYDNPNLNFSAKFIAFEEETGRVLCEGNNGVSSRLIDGKYVDHNCPGSEHCDFGMIHNCKPHGRLFVQVEGQDDYLGVFIHRTSGINTTRYISSRLSQMHAMMRGRIAGFPLSLLMRKKNSQIAGGSIVFLDIVFREGMGLLELKAEQDRFRQEWDEMGWSREEFERSVKEALKHGTSEIEADEGLAIRAEFYGSSGGKSPKSKPDQQQKKTGSTDGFVQGNPLASLAARIKNEIKIQEKPKEAAGSAENQVVDGGLELA